MPRRMSCSMTIDAVRDQTKTVTRRHVDTWKTLTPGDQLTLIEKGMGLPKGAKQVELAEVEIVAVSVQACCASSVPHRARVFPTCPRRSSSGSGWPGHGYRSTLDPHDVPCRRIEWRYLDGAGS